MDLIEVLWKQDVDLGYNPSLSLPIAQKETTAEDDIEKLKALLEMKDDKVRSNSNLNIYFIEHNMINRLIIFS